jgi:hypothetical protein
MAATALIVAAPAAAQMNWVQLGSREVSDRAERDLIPTQGGQIYNQIRLCVDRAPVRFGDVAVRYRNGASQNMSVHDLIERGRCTAPLDLRGRNRDIESVSFTYEAASLGRRTARVRLLAV